MYLAIFAGLTAVGCKDYDYMPGVIKVNVADKTIVLTNVNDFNEFEVSCPMSWAVTGTVPSWLGVDPPKGGAGITPTTLTIKEAHTGDVPRTAILRFMAANGDKVAVTVTQNPSDPTPPAPLGEVIVYDGSNHEVLKPGPFGWWDDENCLYPSLTSWTYNQVSLTGGTVIFVYGGLANAEGATVAHNTVTMSGGEASDLTGGWSLNGDAANNSAHMSGGNLQHIDGGTGFRDAIGNRAIVSGGEVFSVYGGYSMSGDATGNHVIISGGTVFGLVCGGGGPGSATGNTVSLSGTPNLSNAGITGGRSFAGGAATGNTLEVTVQHPGVEAKTIGNFDKAVFYLPHNAADGDVLLKVSAGWSDLSGVTIDIDFADIIPSLKVGDMITLIDSHSLDAPLNNNQIVSKNGYSFLVFTEDDKLYAQVTATPSDPTPPTPSGEIIVYDGSKPDMLKPDPFGWGSGVWLYPSMTSLAYNQVSVTGGFVENVCGGVTDVEGATVAHNTVTVSGGEAEFVYGGYSMFGDATGNHVIISGGAVTSIVMGGISDSGNASGNKVTLSGTPDLSRAGIFGGVSPLEDWYVKTGNILEVRAPRTGMEVRDIGEFNKVVFYLPHDVAHGDVLLRVSGTWMMEYFGVIDIDFADALPSLKVGDSFILFYSEWGGTQGEMTISKNGYTFFVGKEDFYHTYAVVMAIP